MIDPLKRWKYLSIGLMGILALVALPATIAPQANAVSDNTNLIQQILNIVMDIQTKVNALTGVGGSLSALQSDVTAIKAQTDNLPADPASEATVNTRANQSSLDALQQSVNNLSTGGFTQVTYFTGTGNVQCTADHDFIAYADTFFTSDNFQVFLENQVGNFDGAGITNVGNNERSYHITLGNDANRLVQIEYKDAGSEDPIGSATVFVIYTAEGANVNCSEY